MSGDEVRVGGEEGLLVRVVDDFSCVDDVVDFSGIVVVVETTLVIFLRVVWGVCLTAVDVACVEVENMEDELEIVLIIGDAVVTTVVTGKDVVVCGSDGEVLRGVNAVVFGCVEVLIVVVTGVVGIVVVDAILDVPGSC